MVNRLDTFFAGLTAYKKKAAANTQACGQIEICPETGHTLYWWDWKSWVADRSKMTRDFWTEFLAVHKGTGDAVAKFVREHFQAADKYAKLSLNARTQGRGAVIFKDSGKAIFDWIIDHGYFNQIKLCVGVHDEWNIEYPEQVTEFPKILQSIMETSASKYCHTLPIPAEASVDTHWVH